MRERIGKARQTKKGQSQHRGHDPMTTSELYLYFYRQGKTDAEIRSIIGLPPAP